MTRVYSAFHKGNPALLALKTEILQGTALDDQASWFFFGDIGERRLMSTYYGEANVKQYKYPASQGVLWPWIRKYAYAYASASAYAYASASAYAYAYAYDYAYAYALPGEKELLPRVRAVAGIVQYLGNYYASED